MEIHDFSMRLGGKTSGEGGVVQGVGVLRLEGVQRHSKEETMKNEIVLFESTDNVVKLEVAVNQETVWLTQ